MKRWERNFAYRGVLTGIVGALLCVPGVLLWLWPTWFGLENSRNVRPMIMRVSLIAGGVLLLAGLAYVVWCAGKWAMQRGAKRKGHSVRAKILCVDKDYSRPARGKPAYILRCMYTDEKGKIWMFRSPPLKKDPAKRLKDEITVWCDPKDYTRHYVDVAGSLRPRRLPQKLPGKQK